MGWSPSVGWCEAGSGGVSGGPVEEAVGDDRDEACAAEALWVEPHVARLQAGGVAAAETDPEGVPEVVGGVERVLPFEDGAAHAGETTCDAVDVGVRSPWVGFRRRTGEDEVAVLRVASEVAQVFHLERMPIIAGFGVDYIELLGDLSSDPPEVGTAAGTDHNGVAQLGVTRFSQPFDEPCRRRRPDGISHFHSTVQASTQCSKFQQGSVVGAKFFRTGWMLWLNDKLRWVRGHEGMFLRWGRVAVVCNLEA